MSMVTIFILHWYLDLYAISILWEVEYARFWTRFIHCLHIYIANALIILWNLCNHCIKFVNESQWIFYFHRELRDTTKICGHPIRILTLLF